MKKQTIAFFEVYSEEFYGNQKYTYGIFSNLSQKDFAPHFLSPFEGELAERLRALDKNVTVIPLKTGNKSSIAGRIRILLSYIPFTLKLVITLRRIKPAVIHLNNIYSFILSFAAIKLLKIPSLLYIKGIVNNPVLDRISFYFADRILFQSEKTKTAKYPLLMKKYHSKTSILRNGVDLTSVNRALGKDQTSIKNELGIQQSVFNLVFAGYIVPAKGIHLLIESVKRLLPKNKNFKLFILGGTYDEVYRQELIKIIAASGLKSHIEFLGVREDVLDIISTMDVFITASLAEGMPRSIMEAMALGKPVIASDVGGISDIVVNNKTGIIVEPGNTAAFYKAILSLMNNPSRMEQFGAQARSLIVNEYSIEKNVSTLETFYSQLAGIPK